MDPSALSSNWKKLQSKLKEDSKSKPTSSNTTTSKPTPSTTSTTSKKRKSTTSESTSAKTSKPFLPKRIRLDPSISPNSSASIQAERKRSYFEAQRKNAAPTNEIYKGPKNSKLTEKNLNKVKGVAGEKKMGAFLSGGVVKTASLSSEELSSNSSNSNDREEAIAAAILSKQATTEAHTQNLLASSSSAKRRSSEEKRNLKSQIRSGEDKSRINEGLAPDALSQKGKYIAIDCEMVGVGPNPQNSSALARVSIVSYTGAQLYDSYVLPMEKVTDYRTAVSGITPACLKTARSFAQVQDDVAALMKDSVLVGHAIRNDLSALMLSHPRRDIRDTSSHAPYRAFVGGGKPSLKVLSAGFLGLEIQGGEHSSVEDARATMMLYRRDKETFEKEAQRKYGKVIVERGGEEDAGNGVGSGSAAAKVRRKKGKKKGKHH